MQDDHETKKQADEELRQVRRRLAELESSETERQRTAETLTKRSRDLAERVKELHCLYEIANLATHRDLSVDELLQAAVNLVPASMQYPEISCARIIWAGKEYTAANFTTSAMRQASEITVNGEQAGTVEVCYLEARPAAEEDAFLKEERHLISAIAEHLGSMIEREQTRLALTESARQFRAIFSNSLDGILLADTATQKFSLANEAAAKMLGYEVEELTSMGVADLHREADLPSVQAQFAAAQAGEHEWVSELPMKRKDGSVFYAEMNSTLLSLGGRTYLLGMFRDTTKRRQAEEELRQSENKYRTLLENLPQNIFLKDRSSVYLSCNENYAGDLGLTPADIVGKSDYDFYPKELAEKYRDDDRRLMASGKKEEFDERYLQEGQERIVHTVKTPVKDGQGDTTGILGIFWDVTEHRQAEAEREKLVAELEARNTEIKQFTYMVSHDLKSPLVTIKGFLGLLEQDMAGQDAERTKTDLARINAAADKMQALLNDLLATTRVGRLTNPGEYVPLDEVAREAVDLVAGSIAAGEVEVVIAPELPVVLGDRARLVDVLQNLVDNAVKYMGGQPQPRIEIGARQDGDETVFYVRDNGMGIEPQYQDKVFGLFQQLNQEAEGTGVGLALARRIIEVHGGRIWIESAGAGQGSTFCFTIPPKGKATDDDGNKNAGRTPDYPAG